MKVNKLTGEVRVLKVISANDVGMAVNPLGLQGQVEGGVMMGLGNCLTEEFIVEDGYVVTDRLARYRVPGIMLTPEITSIIVEHPTAEGPYGAKGVGEMCSEKLPGVAAYKMLRTQVLQRMKEKGWNALAVTSPGPSEGKTLTAVNLAVSLAREVNHTVLLVDLDLRNPSVHQYFGYVPESGVSDVAESVGYRLTSRDRSLQVNDYFGGVYVNYALSRSTRLYFNFSYEYETLRDELERSVLEDDNWDRFYVSLGVTYTLPRIHLPF